MTHPPAECSAPRYPLYSQGSPPHHTQHRIPVPHRLLASVFLFLYLFLLCEDVLSSVVAGLYIFVLHALFRFTFAALSLSTLPVFLSVFPGVLWHWKDTLLTLLSAF